MLELKGNMLVIAAPENKKDSDLVELCKKSFTKEMEFNCLKKDITITGKISPGVALYLGHRLTFICSSVSLYNNETKDCITLFSR